MVFFPSFPWQLSFLVVAQTKKKMAAFELYSSYRNGWSFSSPADGLSVSDWVASAGWESLDANTHRTHVDTFADMGYINKTWKKCVFFGGMGGVLLIGEASKLPARVQVASYCRQVTQINFGKNGKGQATQLATEIHVLSGSRG